MRGLSHQRRSRKIGAQIDRTHNKWPTFEVRDRSSEHVLWHGQLRGFQLIYFVGVYWTLNGSIDRPYVFLLEPPLRPREGGTYEEIPHLMFDDENPKLSGLCLFDPDGNEWKSCMLIADTTVPWTADWLLFYELWHYDGKWRGGGVGPESIAQARTKTIHGPT